MSWSARKLQKLVGIDQVHIVGCARSGTTMAQFAMIAFRDVMVANLESRPQYPATDDLLEYLIRNPRIWRRRVLVTKRGYHWYAKEQVEEVVRRARTDGLGVIYLVRDPRDVLVSAHGGDKSGRSYVPVDRWAQSMRAGEKLLSDLDGYSRLLVLRYEDLVANTPVAQAAIQQTFGLALADGVTSMANIATNLAATKYRVAPEMLVAMHKLRAFDKESVGRWAAKGFDQQSAMRDKETNELFGFVLNKYQYESVRAVVS